MKTSRRIPAVPLLIFLVCVVGIATGGWLLFDRAKREVEQEAQRNLAAIEDIKIGQIAHWRRERLGDAEVISRSPLNGLRILPFLERASPADKGEDIKEWMESFRSGYSYKDLVLFDRQGKARLWVGTTEQEICATDRVNVAVVIQSGKPMLSDFHRSETTGHVHLDLCAPLLGKKNAAGTPDCVGVMLLEIDPDVFLYPLIQTWPTPSATAETLLVRCEGNEVVFLNELRHKTNTALNMRAPLAKLNLPAAMAARGKEGMFYGVDYRSVPVLAALRRVPDSPWAMVSKVDQAEVVAPFHTRAVLIVSLAAGAVVVLGLALLFWRKGREADVYRRALELERRREEVERECRTILQTSVDGFWITDTREGRFLDVNDAYCRMVGYTRDELLRMRIPDVEAKEKPEETARHIRAVVEKGYERFETRHRCKDGRIIEVEISAQCSDVRGGAFVVFVKDITERRQAEAIAQSRRKMLEEISGGGALNELLDALLKHTADIFPGHPCSVLLLDAEGRRLRTGAARGLPEFYNEAIDGLEIGPTVGSCGAAAYGGKRVVVADIAAHPNWAPFRDLARQAGLAACWSEPICSPAGETLGTFAIYSAQTESPTEEALRVLEDAAAFAGLVITRKQSEEAVRESEEKFRGMASAARSAIIMIDSAGRITFWNDAAGTIFGWSAAEALGKDVHELLAPESRRAAGHKGFAEFQKTGRGPVVERCVELPALRKNGEEFPVEMSLSAVRLRGEWHAIGILNDITERKRAVEMLHQSQAELNRAQSVAHIGSWRLDVRRNELSWSDETYRIFGIPAGTPLTYESFLAGIHPEDRAMVDARWQAALRGAPYDVEHRIAVGDRVKWVREQAELDFDERGVLLGGFGTVQDITERKQTEETLSFLAQCGVAEGEDFFKSLARYLAGALGMEFVFIDRLEADNQVARALAAYCDGRFEENVFYALKDTPCGDVVQEGVCCFHSGICQRFPKDAMLQQMGAESYAGIILRNYCGQPVGLIAAVGRRPLKEPALAESLLKLVAGRAAGELERERSQEALKEAKDAAEAANRAKSTFLANMSHEIRTPMNAILGYSQLMQRDASLSPEARGNLNIINRSGEHLLNLINDVLEMSKIEAGRITLDQTTFDLTALLADLAAMFRLRTEAKGLAFETAVLGEVPQFIVADEGKVRQVLVNLLGNAVKFTERGGIILRVSAAKDGGGQLRLAAEVEDTGVGIAVEQMDRLFQHFEQTASGRQVRAGTGLGLAISREYARLMGGDVTATSQPGKGSVFRFETPIKETAERLPPTRIIRQRVIGLKPGREAVRVLVADDNAANRGWLTKLLVSVGFQVREAADGAEAVRVWEEWKPQLILMDMRMPGMDGYEATRQIKTHPGGAAGLFALRMLVVGVPPLGGFEHLAA